MRLARYLFILVSFVSFGCASSVSVKIKEIQDSGSAKWSHCTALSLDADKYPSILLFRERKLEGFKVFPEVNNDGSIWEVHWGTESKKQRLFILLRDGGGVSLYGPAEEPRANKIPLGELHGEFYNRSYRDDLGFSGGVDLFLFKNGWLIHEEANDIKYILQGSAN